MPVPNTFANATGTIPLSQLDNNFATAITIGNTAVQLGNTITTVNNVTLVNATVSSVSTPITVAQGGTGLTTATAANNAIYSTSSSALTAGTLPVAAGGTGATTLTSNNVIIGNGTGTVTFVAPGTSGNVLTSNGSAWLSQAAAGGSAVQIQSQLFTANGTWTAPTGVTQARVWAYGGGGGGGGGENNPCGVSGSQGATGGAVFAQVTVTPGTGYTVTIGAGGTGGALNGGNGTSGATTSFGALVSCTGGGFGRGYNKGNTPATPGSGTVTGTVFRNKAGLTGTYLPYAFGGDRAPANSTARRAFSTTDIYGAGYPGEGGGAVQAGGGGVDGIVFVEWVGA